MLRSSKFPGELVFFLCLTPARVSGSWRGKT